MGNELIIGKNIKINEKDIVEINETERHKIQLITRRDYRKRIETIVDFSKLIENYYE